MIFKVLELYGVASIQTVETPNRRHFGVPVGGPFDRLSHGLANALLGNDEGDPCIELSLTALRIQVLREGTLAWVGAGAWQGTRGFHSGDVVSLQFPVKGARSYLAGIGGLRSQASKPELISAGQVFEAGEGIRNDRALAETTKSVTTVRVYKGSHAGLLDWHRFINGSFVVSNDSNRMGIRLIAAENVVHGVDLPSEPTDVGVIQMPGSGNPIILGPDGPTIGGYPRVASVIESDLSAVAQLEPGRTIHFMEVDRESGALQNQTWRASENWLKSMLRAQALG